MQKCVEWILDNFTVILFFFLTGREVWIEDEITNLALWFLILTLGTIVIKTLKSIESKLDYKEK